MNTHNNLNLRLSGQFIASECYFNLLPISFARLKAFWIELQIARVQDTI